MAAVYTLEELATQVVHLTGEIRTLQRQLADQAAAQPAARDDAMEGKSKGFFFEKKLWCLRSSSGPRASRTGRRT